jgi:asparagine synthase (glutamine-hydrolysing)
MCGIWTYINLINNVLDYNLLYNNFMKIKHRGPDFSNFQIYKNIILGFHRLSIMDLKNHANQPYIFETDENNTIIFMCNGEIYNFKELIVKHNLNIIDNSDCMVIPKLYLKYKNNFYKYIDDIKGEFAFIIFELNNLNKLNKILICRDEIGIRPLYYNDNDNIIISSEIKGLVDITKNIKEFEPGILLSIEFNSLNEIINKHCYEYKTVHLTNFIVSNNYIENIRNSIINSIKRRLVSDKPIVFLLSGGIDSSIICAVAAKILNYPIKTFCCGMNNGTDLKYAKIVADHIGSIHTEVLFNYQDGLDIIDKVIYTTETWDTTTIRASVGQYLVCKYISENTDAKVILVGEGPDEVCSSYLFNYYAPTTGYELHSVAKKYVKNIHMYDGRRVDRCISNFGLEARIPLLDTEFIKSYWEIPSEYRHPKYNNIEKWHLRKAFEDLLPQEIIWRKKEAFSDGVSNNEKSWYQIIQDYIETKVDENVEPTKEAYYYKQKFIEYFGKNKVDVLSNGYWIPYWNENGHVTEYIDPSARTLSVY